MKPIPSLLLTQIEQSIQSINARIGDCLTPELLPLYSESLHHLCRSLSTLRMSNAQLSSSNQDTPVERPDLTNP